MTCYKILLIIADVLTIPISLFLSLLLRFDTHIPATYYLFFKVTHPIICLIFISVFFISGLYKSLWKYASIQELFQISLAVPLANLCAFSYGLFTQQLFPKSIYIINTLILLFCTSGIRINYRLFRRLKYRLLEHLSAANIPNIMIVGAGTAGLTVLKEYQSTKLLGRVRVFLDDNPQKKHCLLHGIPVAGCCNDLPKFVSQYNISQIILALPSVSKKRIAEILQLADHTSCKVLIFPGVSNSLTNESTLKQLRPVQIEDLLGRDEIILDNHLITHYIQNQTVMVTGGGGSIGSELCRQISKLHPRKLIIFDIYENNAYDLQNELLRNGFPVQNLDILIGSVRDLKKLEQVFEKYHPDIIFHAAAHKHVPLMESNPTEAIKNNIFGTYNVAKCALNYKAKKFILISTDKAVNPTNVMGASKRFCEMIIQAISHSSEFTEFCAVRFGNVLGSNGSVIPLFKRQIEAGGPVTITHPDIIRYFMTIPEAVRLILQAMSFAHGGEIFVLDMGEPVKILDLAKNLITLSGLKVGEDIEIQFTGLRPGEKLFEELLMAQKDLHSTSCNKIFVEKPLTLSYQTIMEDLNYLEKSLEQGNDIKAALQKVVPTYHPAPESMKPLPPITKPTTSPKIMPEQAPYAI